ncbi:hypothetical protein Tco_0115286 [Tanacetum coccineum]
MSSATSAVTYTSVYTDSEPGRAFWGADDEEILREGVHDDEYRGWDASDYSYGRGDDKMMMTTIHLGMDADVRRDDEDRRMEEKGT